MNVQSYYRIAVWLPLLIPAAVAYAVHVLALRPADGPLETVVQILLVSGIYGGPPYAALAAYATWWIDARPEAELRRRALVAPLWMIAVWFPCAVIVGVLYGRLDTFFGFLGLGVAIILPLGYAYVGLTLLLRPFVCRDARDSTPIRT